MCEKCNDEHELEKMIYDEWLAQEGIKEGNMVKSSSQTVVLGGSDSILIMQKQYDRSLITEEGIQVLPDSKVNSIEISPSKLEDFIGELIFAAGPQTFMKMLSESLNRIGIEGDEEDG